MPLIFETSCRNCGKKAQEISDYDSFHLDGKDIPISHTYGSVEVEKFGFKKAIRSGLIHRNDAFVCASCGSVFYAKSLMVPYVATKAIVLVTLLVLFVLALFVRRNPWMLGLVAALAVLRLGTHLYNVSIERRLKRQELPPRNTCRRCGSSDIKNITEFLSNEQATLSCDDCGERQRRCDRTAIS